MYQETNVFKVSHTKLKISKNQKATVRIKTIREMNFTLCFDTYIKTSNILCLYLVNDIYLYVYIYKNICNIYIYIHYIYTYVFIYIYIYIYIYICIYIYIYIYMYLYIYKYIYILYIDTATPVASCANCQVSF